MKLGELSTQHVVSVGPEDAVVQAMTVMEQYGIHHLPVVSGTQIVGIVSDRDIMIGYGELAENSHSQGGEPLKLGKVKDMMSQPVFTLSPDDVLRSATWLMTHRRVHAIPLVHRDRLVGMVTASDLLRGVNTSSEFSTSSLLEQPIAKFMHAHVTTVRSTTSLDEAVDIMRRERIHHLPVAFGDELLGIVSDRDVRRALASSTFRDARAQEQGKFYLGPREVHQIMTTEVQTIPSSANARRAITELLRHGIHSLPIVDARKLVGIITDSDLLRAIGAEEKEAS